MVILYAQGIGKDKDMDTNSISTERSDIEMLHFKISKKLVGEPFLSKAGRELREVRIPNESNDDKTPWRRFVVGANSVHLDRYSNGRLNYISLPADGFVTVKKDIETGVDAEGRKVYETLSEQVPNIQIKAIYSKMRDEFIVEQVLNRQENPSEKKSLVEKINKNQEELQAGEKKGQEKGIETEDKETTKKSSRKHTEEL